MLLSTAKFIYFSKNRKLKLLPYANFALSRLLFLAEEFAMFLTVEPQYIVASNICKLSLCSLGYIIIIMNYV